MTQHSLDAPDRHVVSREQTLRLETGERFVRSWVKRGTSSESLPMPVVLGLIHGLGDHSGRFDGLGRWFASHGCHVYCFDQFGHGISPGQRLRVPSYEFLLQDIEAFLAYLTAAHPDSFIVLFGQSMGGNLVLNHHLRGYSQAGLIIAGSPMLRAVNTPGPISLYALRLLSYLVPNYRLDANVDPTRLSRDPEMQRAFEADALVQKGITLRLGRDLIDSGNWAINHAEKLSTPTLIMHGDADLITCHRASLEFGGQSGGRAEVRIWPEGMHDLHHDIIRDEYFSSIYDWIIAEATKQAT